MVRATMVVVSLLVVGCSSGPGAPAGAPASPTGSTPGVSGPSEEAPRSPAPTGSSVASVSDPVGDVTDPDGNPPPAGGPAADLTTVTLRRDAGGLTVRFEVSGAVPPSADSLLWSVELDGQQRYLVAAQLTGGELNAGVYDDRRDVQHALNDVEVEGGLITLNVPADELDGLGATFDWSASTQLDGAYEDHTATASLEASG